MPLFDETLCAPHAPAVRDRAALLADLVGSGDPRLAAAAACLLVVIDAPDRAAERAAQALPPEGRRLLGTIYRTARALSIARAPDLSIERVREHPLPAWTGEDTSLPDPDAHKGEALLRDAPRLSPASGDAIDLFGAWLEELRLARRAGPR